MIDQIQPIVEHAYGKGSMSQALAEHLAKSINNYRPHFPGQTREDMIRETCWSWMTGGGTATIVAQRIEAALQSVAGNLDPSSPAAETVRRDIGGTTC